MSVAYDYKVRTNYAEDVQSLRAAHKVLTQVSFTPSLPERGYTRRTLFIDLDTMSISEKPVTDQMKDVFIGRARLRPVLPLARHHAPDQVERPRERDHHQPGAAGRQHAVPGLRQVAGGHPLAADRHSHRLQRGRLLRAAPEVLRASTPLEIQGKAKTRRDRGHRRPEGMITIEEAPEETPDSHIAAEMFTHMYADDATRHAEHLGGLGRAGGRARPTWAA